VSELIPPNSFTALTLPEMPQLIHFFSVHISAPPHFCLTFCFFWPWFQVSPPWTVFLRWRNWPLCRVIPQTRSPPSKFSPSGDPKAGSFVPHSGFNPLLWDCSPQVSPGPSSPTFVLLRKVWVAVNPPDPFLFPFSLFLLFSAVQNGRELGCPLYAKNYAAEVRFAFPPPPPPPPGLVDGGHPHFGRIAPPGRSLVWGPPSGSSKSSLVFPVCFSVKASAPLLAKCVCYSFVQCYPIRSRRGGFTELSLTPWSTFES